MYACRIRDAGDSDLEFVDPLRVPVEIERLWIETVAGASTPIATAALPTLLPPSWPEAPSHIERLRLDPEPALRPARIRGIATAAGSSYEFEVRDYQPVLESPPLPRRASLAELKLQHPYLTWSGHGLEIAAGHHRVAQALVIPASR